ncbi:hypothetical protein M885DRAFT_549923 [Pelagophyceae sp. CCMP2097]|nr:hypothetical protein M885DRAFT_549923 [Pelagophyceae sp. CCMP2097]
MELEPSRPGCAHLLLRPMRTARSDPPDSTKENITHLHSTASRGTIGRLPRFSGVPAPPRVARALRGGPGRAPPTGVVSSAPSRLRATAISPFNSLFSCCARSVRRKYTSF